MAGAHMHTEQHTFTICPKDGCGGSIVYGDREVLCAKGHKFDGYAYGALLEVLPEYKRGKFMYVSTDVYTALMDRNARLWNSLVNFSSENGKFKGKLLDIAIELRDEAHRESDRRETQMDYEVDRMKAAGWVSYEGKS